MPFLSDQYLEKSFLRIVFLLDFEWESAAALHLHGSHNARKMMPRFCEGSLKKQLFMYSNESAFK